MAVATDSAYGIFSTTTPKMSTRPRQAAPAAVAVFLLLLLTALASTTAAAATTATATANHQQQHRQRQRQAQQQQKQRPSSIVLGSSMESAITVSSILEIDEECYAPLYNSDLDGDGRVDRDEYVVFANSISDDYFAQACRSNNPQKCNFDKLPLAMQSNFINLACLCERFGGSEDCCVGDQAHIATDGAGPDDDPSNTEALYLFTVCRDTYTAVEEVQTPPPTIGTASPTGKPTKAPTTASPTKEPTAKPTAVQETPEPTPQPTTASPTVKPTVKITPEPTPSPTTAPPTPPPTQSPVRTTDDPTVAPTPSPTTRAPVTTPTIVTPSPTVATTAAPTTSSPTTTPLTTGPLPVSFDYTISNLQGYDADDVETGTGGNTMKDDLEGALAILVPQIVEETFGGNGNSGGGRQRGRRRMRMRVGGLVPQEKQQHRRRKLLVEYDPSADPATVDSLEDIGEFIFTDLCFLVVLLFSLLICTKSIPLCLTYKCLTLPFLPAYSPKRLPRRNSGRIDVSVGNVHGHIAAHRRESDGRHEGL